MEARTPEPLNPAKLVGRTITTQPPTHVLTEQHPSMSMRSVVLSIVAIAAIAVVMFAVSREGSVPGTGDPASASSSASAHAIPSESALLHPGASAADAEPVDPAREQPPSAALNPSATADDHVLHTELTGSAMLRARLLDAGGRPISGARVRLAVDPDETVARRRRALADESEIRRWNGQTNADGTCVLQGLPAELLLRPGILRDARAPAVELEAFTLERGEVRDVVWRMTDGYELTGLVLDQEDRPVADLEVLLARPVPGLTPADQVYVESDIVARARTDKAGSFRMSAVPAGTWWLGPEPPGGQHRATRNVVALALVVEIPPRSSSADIVLHVERGLSIRGRVVDPNGASAGRQWVTAKQESSEVPVAVMSAADGTFSVGPLRAGRCELYVGGGGDVSGSEYLAPSKPVIAQAGDGGVVLQLEIGGTIDGRVIDRRTGAGVQARIWLSARGTTPFSLVESSTAPDSSFRFQHLNAGTYDIGVQSAAGLCGIAKGIVVEASAPTKGVVVHVDPNATLLVRYVGTPERAGVGVKMDGVRLPGGGMIARGTTMNVFVPAGRSVLEVYLLGQGEMPERSIDIAAGEVRELVISDRE
jgi:hypothetical protein